MKKKLISSILLLSSLITVVSCSSKIKNDDADITDSSTIIEASSSSVSQSSDLAFSSSNITTSSQALSSKIESSSIIASSTQASSSQAVSSKAASSSQIASSSAIASSSSVASSSAITSSSTAQSSSSSAQNDGIEIVDLCAYTEGAYITWNVESNELNSSYQVSYSSNNSTYKTIDTELIRINNNVARADILGLKAGNYNIKIKRLSDNKEIISNSITVTKDDRSGYAHFNRSTGIGAYNNDGTLKENAIVVYVNDNNKNTVKATVNGKERTGLAEIIKAASSSSESLDIRILGEIQTTQWNSKTHGTGKTTTRQSNLDNTFSSVDWEVTTENELKIPGTSRSNNYYKICEADIISYGINSMSNDLDKGITQLNGLTNNILKDKAATTDDGDQGGASHYEYDSYYNELDVKTCKNITIEGIGSDAKIFQWGFCFNQCDSIEVKNIEFSDYTEDAIGIQGASDVTKHSGYWIHNCTFNQGKNNWDVSCENDKKEGDGSTDFKAAHDLTISYCRYNSTHKTALIGSGDSSYQYNITFHHNYYNACGSRLPFTRNSNIHIYNCYYSKSTGTNMQIYTNAYTFIEGCYFDNTNKTFTTSKNGVIKLYNNIVNGTSSVSGTGINYVDSRTTTVTNSCMADTSTDYSTFDIDSSLFYYNNQNNISDVDLMLKASDVKDYIPTVAGSGLLKTLDYSMNYVENNSAPVDSKTYATYTSTTPLATGLYYSGIDKDNNTISESTLGNTNKVYEENGKISVIDSSSSYTTIGYKIFDSKDIYNSGKVEYKFTLILGSEIGSKWNLVRFLDNDGKEVLSIRMGANKVMSYTLDGSTEISISSTVFSANKSYEISLIVDYDNNEAQLSIGSDKVTISNFNISSIIGIKLFTNIGNSRSFDIDNLTITEK